ncbi:MAG: M42 family metallopeptidase [Ruminococcaceae bacterium]|nr:M42 family metallopeptidase [Oscillospiraceae bacterium]
MNFEKYTDYSIEKTVEILAIDSPTGYTDTAALWTKAQFESLGFKASLTNKGGVIVDLGGVDTENALLLYAHIDTLGGIVCEIKGNGRLKISKLGGIHPHGAEFENVKVYTRDGRSYEGTFMLCNPSVHVNGSYDSTNRNFDTMEVVLDEKVSSSSDVRALGIENGDVVCFDPRTKITTSGYIKSRFLDDKLAVGMLLGFAKYLKDNGITPKRRIYAHITVYEEIGHGGAASIPAGVTEGLALDMGCVGSGLMGSEHKVSICAKDASGPYCYSMTTALINAAKDSGADYAVDVYPFYGSDVEASLRSGHDIRHGLIGAGVFASHGYERSHRDGVENTLKLLCKYLDV